MSAKDIPDISSRIVSLASLGSSSGIFPPTAVSFVGLRDNVAACF